MNNNLSWIERTKSDKSIIKYNESEGNFLIGVGFSKQKCAMAKNTKYLLIVLNLINLLLLVKKVFNYHSLEY
jgi:hypothetical protein